MKDLLSLCNSDFQINNLKKIKNSRMKAGSPGEPGEGVRKARELSGRHGEGSLARVAAPRLFRGC